MARHAHRNRLVAVFFAAAMTLGLAGLVRSAEVSSEEKARLHKLDTGAATIDVSKYPADQKSAYTLFQKKCAQCHKIARPINSNFVLPGEWERYIKRMMYKPNSKLKEDDGKTIYRFLTYDSSVRKADSLRVHLKNLPASDREEALEKIHKVNPAFKEEK
jgi:hypothetical protein